MLLDSTDGLHSRVSTHALFGTHSKPGFIKSSVVGLFSPCKTGQQRNSALCFHSPLFAGIPGSDYINANYIDGYRKQNAYIATQGALPETFGDFWRMMWEQQGATVVMMTKLEERSRVRKTYARLKILYLSYH